MQEKGIIKVCSMEHTDRYGEIYAEAFSGEPWNDSWSVEDATVHVRELLENKEAYGLEYIWQDQIAGFVLGTSMLFHDGRVFVINDLAVARAYHGQGIATQLMERLIEDMKSRDIKRMHLITAGQGKLPKFYEKFGFAKENYIILMGKDMQHLPTDSKEQ